MITYAIRFKGTYLRFGSHKTAQPVDSVLKATLYSSKTLAEGRVRGKFGYAYIKGIRYESEDLEIVEVTLAVQSETAV